MAEVRCEVDQVGTRVLVRLHGDLCATTAPRVRTTLLKCLVDQPDALVVDLAGLTVPEPMALAVFIAVARQAAMWPGTPIILSAPPAEVAELLAGGGYGRLTVLPSTDSALAAEPRRAIRALGETLLPVSGAARRARELAAEACLRWDLPHLELPAGLVAGELVTNAVVHANTMVDLRISLGHRYLLIAVRDGSSAEPRLCQGDLSDPRMGRGLILVEEVAQRWGSLPAQGGKVVWASLSRRASPAE